MEQWSKGHGDNTQGTPHVTAVRALVNTPVVQVAEIYSYGISISGGCLGSVGTKGHI